MIETQIVTIVACDQCDAQVEIDAGLPTDARRPDLDIVEGRAWAECESDGWMVTSDRHLCDDCADDVELEVVKEESK